MKTIEDIEARTTKMTWDAPPRLSLTQSFPCHFTHLWSSCLKHDTPIEIGEGSTTIEKARKVLYPVLIVDYYKLLSAYCAGTGGLIKKSKIAHPMSGSVQYATKPFGRGPIFGYYYGLRRMRIYMVISTR